MKFILLYAAFIFVGTASLPFMTFAPLNILIISFFFQLFENKFFTPFANRPKRLKDFSIQNMSQNNEELYVFLNIYWYISHDSYKRSFSNLRIYLFKVCLLKVVIHFTMNGHRNTSKFRIGITNNAKFINLLNTLGFTQSYT